MSECVKVVVRCRPMNRKESELNCKKIVEVDQKLLQIGLIKPRPGGQEAGNANANNADYEPKRFTFDGVYDDDSKQRDVYDDTAHSLVKSVLEGYNGTIFAYGQTGCGKTFTMEGIRDSQELRGIIPNTFDQIFNHISNSNTSADSDSKLQFLVRASYIEIYNEEVRDLMSNNPKARCELKEDPDKGVFIKGVTNSEVTTVEQLNQLMSAGNLNRSVGATLMNADSSRSHSLFTVTIETSEMQLIGGVEEQKIKVGKLNLVDLAGSERQSKTQAQGARLKEATKINLSLSALGNVIEALVKVSGGDKGRHIPYRDSKLTRLLQDSLGGNTKTIMIAAVSPADYNYEETLSTLRYANRAKNIKNKPKINEDPKDAMLREYQDEISRLKSLLEERGLGDLLSELTSPGAGTGAKKTTATANNSAAAAAAAASAVSGNSSAGGQTLLSNAEQSRWLEEKKELEDDISKMGEEKAKHEQLARILEEQMRIERETREQLAAEKADIQAKMQQDQNQTAALQQQLQSQQLAIEAEQRKRAELAAELESRMANEITEHQRAADQLAAEMEQKLIEERNKATAIQESATNSEQSLKAKLAKLQQKLLSGSQKVRDMKAEQNEQLRAAQAAEKELRKRELQLQAEKAAAEDAKLLLEENYSSIKDEVTGKTKKLHLLTKKYSELKSEYSESESLWENEKEGFLTNIRDIYKELRLYKRICESFLTSNDMEKIVRNSTFDEKQDQWNLPKIDLPIMFPTIRVMNNNTTATTANGTSNNGYLHGRKGSVANNSSSNGRMNSASQSNRPHNHNPSIDTSDGATAGWKRSVLSTINPEELDNTNSNGNNSKRVDSATRGYANRIGSGGRNGPTPPVASAPVTALTEENLNIITANVKRRSVFEPNSSPINSNSETKEDSGNNSNHSSDPLLTIGANVPRRPAFSASNKGPTAATAAVVPADSPQNGPIDSNNNNPIDPITAVTSGLPPRRPAFQPAAIISPTQSNNHSNNPSTVDIDEILNRAPKPRANFNPAAAAVAAAVTHTDNNNNHNNNNNNPIDSALNHKLPQRPKFEPAKPK